MAHRSGLNEVRFKVRRNALLLREFTAAEMVRATGLNPESVRTELQRMREEGLLTSHHHDDRGQGRSGSRVLYRLVDDPEARLSLSESVEAFTPQPTRPDRPTSRHYLWARKLLDRALTAEGPALEQLLSEAGRDLEMAEEAEGGRLASSRVKAHLEYERVRLAYLRCDHDEAEQRCGTLRRFLADVHDEAMLGKVEEVELAIRSLGRCAAQMRGTVDQRTWTRHLLATLDESGYQPRDPLAALFLRSLRALSQSAVVEVRAAASDLATQQIREIVAEALRREQKSPSFEVVPHAGRERLVSPDRTRDSGLRPSYREVPIAQEPTRRPSLSGRPIHD